MTKIEQVRGGRFKGQSIKNVLGLGPMRQQKAILEQFAPAPVSTKASVRSILEQARAPNVKQMGDRGREKRC